MVSIGLATVGAVFYSLGVKGFSSAYPFVWAFLPIPWLVIAVALKWRLVGGILLLLANVTPYIAFSVIMNINPGEALGAAMAVMFTVPLVNVPFTIAGLILIIQRARKKI